MFCATSVGRVAATPKTLAPRNVPYGFSACRACPRNVEIDRSGVSFNPGNFIVEIGPSGRRT